MNPQTLRDYCLSFPDATENIQWGADLVFKIGGKMFAVSCLEPGDTKVSFKCTPEEFAELVEQESINPADYVARYHWVTLVSWSALPDREIRRLIRQSYDLVRAKLPASRRTAGPVTAKTQTKAVTRRAKTARPAAPKARPARAVRTAASKTRGR